MPGPKPMPIEQRIANGNAAKRALPEPLLVAGRPYNGELDVPPAHLGKEAKKFWTDSVGILVGVGIVDRVDIPVLEMMATQYARWRAAAEIVEKEGMMTKGSRGQWREHPAVRMERAAMKEFTAIADQYAMTPVARTRLGLAELHRRTLQAEMGDMLGSTDLVEAEVVDADD